MPLSCLCAKYGAEPADGLVSLAERLEAVVVVGGVLFVHEQFQPQVEFSIHNVMIPSWLKKTAKSPLNLYPCQIFVR